MTDVSASPSRPKIPVWRTAYDAYRLGLGAVFSSGAMFRYFIYGSVLMLGIFAAEIYLSLVNAGLFSNFVSGRDALSIFAIDVAIGLLSYILLAIVQTPLGIAIHRRVLLGDSPKGSYRGYAIGGHGSSFLIASIVIYAAFFAASLAYVPVVFLLYGVNPFDETSFSGLMISHRASILVIMSIWFFAYFAASLLSVKCAFAFPTAACGRLGALLQQSFAETRGSMWRLFFVFLLVFVPVVVVYLVASITAALAYVVPYLTNADAGSVGSGEDMMMGLLLSPHIIIAGLVVFVAVMFSYVAMAAGAARAYQIRVERGLSGVAEVFS